jgi:hypothetical protein
MLLNCEDEGAIHPFSRLLPLPEKGAGCPGD